MKRKTISDTNIILATTLITLILLILLQTPNAHASRIEPEWIYDGEFFSVSMSPDGSYIGALTEKSFFLFRKDSNVPLWIYNATDNFPVGMQRIIRFSSDGKLVSIYHRWEYLGGGDYSIRTLVFECDKGPLPVREFPGRGLISPNGEYVATFTPEGILFFETENTTPIWTYNIDVSRLSISSDGDHLVAYVSSGPIYVFSGDSGDLLWTYNIGQGFERAVISNDGNYIVAIGTDNSGIERAFFFATTDSTPLWVSGVEMEETPTHISLSANGSVIAMSEWNTGRLYVFESDNPFEPNISYVIDKNKKLFGGVSISSDGKNIIAGTLYGLYSYEYDNGNLTLRWSYDKEKTERGCFTIWGTATSADGRYVACARWETDGRSGLYLFDNFRELEPEPYNLLNQWWLWSIAVGGIAALAVGVYFLKRKKSTP